MTCTIDERATDIPVRAVTPSTGREMIEGAWAMLPWLVGVVPFGLIVGMTAATSSVSTAVGLATGATIYSGSAQLTAIEMLDAGAGIAVIVIAVLVINARLILYGSSIAPHWRGTGRGFRAGAAYLLVDPSFAVGISRYSDPRGGGHAHYIGAGITLWVAWHAAMVAGAIFGGGLPSWLPLEHAVPLFLLAELVRVAQTRPALTAAMVGGVVTFVGQRLPLHMGLLVGVVGAVGCAVLVERRSS